jgi:hypothetical protein
MRSSRSLDRVAALLFCCGAAAACVPSLAARAEPVQMVFGINAQLPTSTKSQIPGAIPTSGSVGSVADPRFTNFGTKINRSPTNNQWITVATTNQTPGSADQVLIIGNGLTIPAGAVSAREGVTQTVGGDLLNFSLLSIPRMNDSGQWVMGYRPAGGTATTERVAKWDGVTLYTAFQPNDMVAAGGGTELFGPFDFGSNPVSGASIASSGAVSFLSTAPTPTIFGASGATVIASVNVTVPSGQVGGDTSLLTTLSQFSQNAAATHWLVNGKVGSDTSKDAVVIVDGAVVVQKGSVLAGSGFTSPVGAISEAFMELSGDWYVRGSNSEATPTHWVAKNGVVVATSGASITPGSSEHWKTGSSTPFLDVRGNNAGNYILVGNTDNATATLASVLVLNGVRVVTRLSDPVDVGDGVTPANSLFVHSPFQTNGTFNNDGYYYFFSRLKATAAGTTGASGSNNASLLRVFACPPDYDQSGGLSVQDIFAFLNGWFANSIAADFDHSGDLAVLDIFAFLNGWFTGC